MLHVMLLTCHGCSRDHSTAQDCGALWPTAGPVYCLVYPASSRVPSFPFIRHFRTTAVSTVANSRTNAVPDFAAATMRTWLVCTRDIRSSARNPYTQQRRSTLENVMEKATLVS